MTADVRGEAHPLELLADRCEREEPSRELDEAILEATCDAKVEMIDGFKGIRYGAQRYVEPYGTLPCFTTSLDSAVTLVPKGHGWHGGDGYGSTKAWARVFPHGRMAAGTGNREAATTALALCAASLRARAAIVKATSGAVISGGTE